MKILLLDNYDSFTYNLVQCLRQAGVTELDVVRNDALTIDDARRYDGIVLSPGPGIPREAGMMSAIVTALAPEKRILGVCLGHQCIGEVFGASLSNMDVVCHGKSIETFHSEDDYLFTGISSPFLSGRYHSWIVASDGLPTCLEILARDAEDRIMALRHTDYDVRGIQFHPESILTPAGQQMIDNWIEAGRNL